MLDQAILPLLGRGGMRRAASHVLGALAGGLPSPPRRRRATAGPSPTWRRSSCAPPATRCSPTPNRASPQNMRTPPAHVVRRPGGRRAAVKDTADRPVRRGDPGVAAQERIRPAGLGDPRRGAAGGVAVASALALRWRVPAGARPPPPRRSTPRSPPASTPTWRAWNERGRRRVLGRARCRLRRRACCRSSPPTWGRSARARPIRAARCRAAAPFVLGFSAVFIALGAAGGLAGWRAHRPPRRADQPRRHRDRRDGARDAGAHPRARPRAHVDAGPWAAHASGSSLLLGGAFGLGWTPCIGPVLGSILALAATGATAARGAGLLAAYAAGLAVPFLASRSGSAGP